MMTRPPIDDIERRQLCCHWATQLSLLGIPGVEFRVLHVAGYVGPCIEMTGEDLDGRTWTIDRPGEVLDALLWTAEPERADILHAIRQQQTGEDD